MINGISAARSALKAFERKLGASANNIANIRTQGFKKSRSSFQELSPQNVSTSSSPTDMAIGGDGFFMVRALKGGNYYTRDGQFQFDKDGRFVTTSGCVVQGWELDPITGEIQGAIQDITLSSFTSPPEETTVGTDGVITGRYSNGQALNLFQVALAKFNNPHGLKKMGSNLYAMTAESGDAITGQPGTNGLGSIGPNALEQSNVDLGEEFVNIILTKIGFQANLKVISAEDEMVGNLLNIIS